VGNDHLNGGAGADRFRFSTALSGSNVDHISDFQHLVDDILLLQSVFAGIGPALTADEFRIGMAQDANDRILYNNITGQLYYDSNANAAGGMMLFATVTAGAVLTFDDFVMV
jgi:serralysin